MIKKVFTCIFLVILLNTNLISSEKDFKDLRIRMVKYQIKGRDIKDPNVLYAMEETPRHFFVPDKQKKYAYEDRPLPIGYGQTISQPYIVALMTELLDIDENSRVLEIGTGSGYQAAILSNIVKEVYTVEIYKELSEQAKNKFIALNYSNIKTLNSDGYHGWKKNAPYDAIIVTCAPTFVPPPLIKQLKIGGKLIIPVGPPFTIQQLLLLKKVNEDKVITEVVCGVSFVPLIREVE